MGIHRVELDRDKVVDRVLKDLGVIRAEIGPVAVKARKVVQADIQAVDQAVVFPEVVKALLVNNLLRGQEPDPASQAREDSQVVVKEEILH